MPSISVVIPVYNAAGYLRRCLECLATSFVKPHEIIVVDDGSTDNSPEVARQFGATVLETGGRRGPAYARNLGARQATGDILFFVDSDVCAYPDTVGRVAMNFAHDPTLDALIGSYDDSPGSGDFLSQYRNLMHCFVHQTGHRKATTFWSGCGAMKRDVFFEFGGFDDTYGRPAIEDIELGYRLAKAGRKLTLDRRLLVKHLKKWSLWSILKTDIRDRGVPWTELILRDSNLPNDLNVQLSQRLSVALVYLMLGIAALTALRWKGYFLLPLFALVFFILSRYWVQNGAKGGKKVGVLALTVAIAGIIWMAYDMDMVGLFPPIVLGYVLLFLRDRYAYASYRLRRTTGVLLGGYMALTVIFILQYLPNHFLVFTFFSILVALIALNIRFYLFLAAKRGRLFAATAIPFHLLYHFYNGISFVVGFSHHMWKKLFVQRIPASTLRPSNEQR